MVTEVRSEQRKAGDIKPGDCIYGSASGWREIDGKKKDGTPRKSVVFTLTDPSGNKFDFWGSNAAISVAIKEIRAGEVVLIVHRGKKIAESGKYKGNAVNDATVYTLNDADVVKIAPVIQLSACRVQNAAAVLAALSLPPMK